ncbi:MAG TPA: hypothetical protein VK700_11780 [Steroidobacteraceae bacterium]|jgi:hypothetical protein|nr:hypothetical protein [Steroidobacteraceae bacterium]
MSRSSASFIRVLCVSAGVLICQSLNGCGGTAATPAGAAPTGTAPAPATLSSSIAVMQQNIAAEAPHVDNSNVVTAFNWKRMLRSRRWQGLNLISTAYAGESNLSAIWDPENGSAPMTGDFAVENMYIGGAFNCDPSTNSCTNGTVTVPEWESLKNYIGQGLDPDFQNSNGAATTVFGRLNSALMVVCVMAQVVPPASLDTDGLPMAGALTLNFPSSTTSTVYQSIGSGGCGVQSSLAGASLSAIVTAVTSTNYTKQMVLNVGQDAITIWAGLTPATGGMNVMVIDDERSTGRYDVGRTIVQMTGANSPGNAVVLFEYLSLGSNIAGSQISCWTGTQWNCDYEFHRGVINESTNQAFLVSNIGLPGDGSGGTGAPVTYVQYTVAGQPSALKSCTAGSSCDATLALSVTAGGQVEPSSNTIYPSAGMSFNACVNASTRAISDDGVLSCDVTGSDVLTGGASNMIEQTRQKFITDVVADLLDVTTASTTLSFTGASDIYTVADAH